MNSNLSSPDNSDVTQTDADNVARPKTTGVLFVLAILVAISTWGMVRFALNLQVRKASNETIAPGLTLTREKLNTPGGNIPMYLLRAQTKQGWKLRFVSADENVNKRRSVSQIATDYNAKNQNRAPVAINGGYFAYDGAAVGAVKIENEWQRLPWKNRTAIGWNSGDKPFIDNLRAVASVKFDEFAAQVTNLNGRPSASTCTVLTWRFAPDYTLKSGEIAVTMHDDKIAQVQREGKVLLPRGVNVLIVGAKVQNIARERLQVLAPGDQAEFAVECTPAKWNATQTILGAGPRLVQNGQIKLTHVEEEFRPDVLARGPRTVLGIDRNGDLMILIIEAWHDKIRGMTLESVASEILRAGAVEAINLDGGSSTTLWVKGKSVTHISDLMDGLKIVEPASDRVEVGVANAVLLEKSAP